MVLILIIVYKALRAHNLKNMISRSTSITLSLGRVFRVAWCHWAASARARLAMKAAKGKSV